MIRHERHFDSRIVRCFAERQGSTYGAFARAAEARGEADAIVFGEERISYAALRREVGRIASGLAGMGLRAGDRMLLLCGNRPEFVSFLYAAFRLGVVVVPVDIRLKAAEIAYIASNCEAALVVYDERLSQEVPGGADLPDGCRTVAVPAAGAAPAFPDIEEGRPDDIHEPASEEDLALIMFTSGTTGRPKGAMITHFNLEHSCQHFHRNIGITAEDRIGVVTPITHVTGLVMGIIGALHAGAAILLLESFRAGPFVEMAAREAMTQTVMVPAMYSLCLLDEGFDKADLSAWRVGNYGGAPMPEGVIMALAEKLPHLQLVNGYGASETCSPAAMLRPGEGLAYAASVGRALHCVDLLVMGEDGREVPPGEAGEIWIGGPMVSPGYWRDPEATARGFVAGYWRSGDIGSLDADGYLHVHDRIKDVVNRGGYKIYSAEVENVLSRFEGVIESAVVGRACPVLGERVHAFVSVSSPGVTAETLRAFCARFLADYKVPETYSISADRLPRSSNGKLQKRELREIAATLPAPAPRRRSA